jgi:L-serine dehydratase
MANERSKINGPAITVCEIDNKIEETVLALLKKEIPIIDEIVLVQTM